MNLGGTKLGKLKNKTPFTDPPYRLSGILSCLPESMASLVGVSFAIVGNLCISVSLNLQKYAHNSIQAQPEPRNYFSAPVWWMGFLLMIVGEIGKYLLAKLASLLMLLPPLFSYLRWARYIKSNHPGGSNLKCCHRTSVSWRKAAVP